MSKRGTKTRKSPLKKKGLLQVMKMLDEYNKKHNCYLSDGEFVSMMEGATSVAKG